MLFYGDSRPVLSVPMKVLLAILILKNLYLQRMSQ